MKKVFIIACSAFLLSACSKQADRYTLESSSSGEAGSSDINPTRATGIAAINQSLDNAARMVAASLKDRDVRTFVKTEAMKQFDGDYDILYSAVKGAAIRGKSLEAIFSGSGQARSSQANSFDRVIANVPNFQVSVPVRCQEWDAVNQTPLVAIAPQGVDEKEVKKIKAYDSDGNVHWLDALTTPDRPVVAVGVSERVDEKGALKYTFEKKNSTAAMRVNGQMTVLGSIRCPNLGHIESWINGKPELRLRVLGSRLIRGSLKPQSVIVVTKFYNPERKDIDGVLRNFNTPLFNWYINWSAPTGNFVYSNEMKFHWVEEDGGSPITVNVKVGGTLKASGGSSLFVNGTASFTIKDNDENLGDALVCFSHPTFNYWYSTGSELEFELD